MDDDGVPHECYVLKIFELAQVADMDQINIWIFIQIAKIKLPLG